MPFSDGTPTIDEIKRWISQGEAIKAFSSSDVVTRLAMQCRLLEDQQVGMKAMLAMKADMVQKTAHLVWGTWIMAAGTILMALVALYGSR